MPPRDARNPFHPEILPASHCAVVGIAAAPRQRAIASKSCLPVNALVVGAFAPSRQRAVSAARHCLQNLRGRHRAEPASGGARTQLGLIELAGDRAEDEPRRLGTLATELLAVIL